MVSQSQPPEDFALSPLMVAYPYGYYPQAVYEKPQPQRKRRNITGEESQEYKIMANKVEVWVCRSSRTGEPR